MNLEKCNTFLHKERIFIKAEKDTINQCDEYNNTDEISGPYVNTQIKSEAIDSSVIMIAEYGKTEMGFDEILVKTEADSEPSSCEDHCDPFSDVKSEMEHPAIYAEPSRETTSKSLKNKPSCRGCMLQAAKNLTNILPNIQSRANCDFCSFLANENKIYKIHFAADTGKRSFSCQLCRYKTDQRFNINKHIIIHTEDRPFACDLCPYKGRLKSSLRSHYIVHTRKSKRMKRK